MRKRDPHLEQDKKEPKVGALPEKPGPTCKNEISTKFFSGYFLRQMRYKISISYKNIKESELHKNVIINKVQDFKLKMKERY